MSIRSLLLMLFLVLSSATPGQAQQAPPLTAVTTVEGISEYRLPNGLQVLLVPDASKPTTTVNVTYRVGSRHEGYGETGMAHLLEHLIFKGTPTTRNVLGELSRRGARANGTTSYDRTNYFASWSANDETLRWYLSWQADAMVNSFIARGDLDTEMTVVRNEMESGENNPSRILLQQTMAAMYQWHNYGKSIIGARSDVENVAIENLQSFYRKHYQPDNATLIVAGKFDTALVLGWVQQYFGPLPRPQRTLTPSYTLDPAQDGERTVTLRRVGGNPVVYIGYHVPAGSHPDFAAVQVLAQVLGDTPGGRLHKRVVERQLAASTFGFSWALAEPSVLILGGQLAPGQDVEKARAEMLSTIDSLVNEPVTAEELERARTQLLNAWEQGFTDPEMVGVQLSEAIGLGDWRLYFLDRDHVRKLTLADVRRVAAERLKRDNRTIGTYLPTAQPERAPPPQRVDVAALVKDYRGEDLKAQVETFDPTPANLDARTVSATLPSGMKLGLLPKGSRGGVVHARLRMNYGDVDSLRGRQGQGSMLAALLDKGGAGLTRQQISDQFDRLRAEVGFGAEEQSLVVSITTRREQLPEVLTLIGRLVREPALPAEALEEVRRARLAAIERSRDEPGSVVSMALDRHDNPYPRGDLRHAANFDEQVQDTRALSVDQLRDFHRRFYSAANAQFAAVGDFDPAAVRAALEPAFGDWRTPSAGALPYLRAPRPFIAQTPARLLLRTPDKQNANLRLHLSLPLRENDPDYPALMVANELLSAGPGSRLWERVREREGLSYGVGSGIGWNAFEPNSRFVIGGIFAPQNLARMEAALIEETNRARRDGFTPEEFQRMRDGLLQQRRLTRAQDAAVAGGLLRNLYLGRSFAVSQRVDEQLAALTVEQVNAALRKYIDPARWALAWGGDFKP